MNPHPEPFFEPFGVTIGPSRDRKSQAFQYPIVAMPQHERLLDSLVELVERDEFQIDVNQRIGIEANEEPRLTNVLTSEGIEQSSQRGCEFAPCCHDARVVILLDDQDEIEVGVLVGFTLPEVAAAEKSDEAPIELQ